MITQAEYIIFLLVISFLLYTRPNVLVNFSNTIIGRVILLVVLVISTLRSTIHGFLIALVIIVFAEELYEGLENNTVQIKPVYQFIGGGILGYNTSSGTPSGFNVFTNSIPGKTKKLVNWNDVLIGYIYANEEPNSVPLYLYAFYNDWAYNTTGKGNLIGYAPTKPYSSPEQTQNVKCPEGYSGPNADGNCTATWSSECGTSCAKDRCAQAGGTWIPLDYANNPYTCKMKMPKPVCEQQSSINSNFVDFTYEYIEQPTNSDTDVVATNPNAQYLKIKTQNMDGCPGASHQFRVHTPAYKPSEGDTVQITLNEYTGFYGTTGGPMAMINGGKWYHKDGEIPVLVYNTGGGCLSGAVTLSILILKGK